MLPLRLFRNRTFSGANATTLAVYAALGAALFMVVLELQLALGYSALEAGASLVPITVADVPAVVAVGRARATHRAPAADDGRPGGDRGRPAALHPRSRPGEHYVTTVLPAAIVFGLGLACTVAPLTATVLASVDDAELGVASGVNNAAARLAGLLAVAVLPSLVHLDTTLGGRRAHRTGSRSRCASARRCRCVGGAISWLTVGAEAAHRARPARPTCCSRVTTRAPATRRARLDRRAH